MVTLRFIAQDKGTGILRCEGTPRPIVGCWLRARQAPSERFLVKKVIDHEHLTGVTDATSVNFGVKLEEDVSPWAPNTPLEVVAWRYIGHNAVRIAGRSDPDCAALEVADR